MLNKKPLKLLKIGLLTYMFCVFYYKVSSEDTIQSSEMITKIEMINSKLDSLAKFGFEVDLEPKSSGRKLKLFGVMDNIKPSESWFVVVDPYLLNMPIEGFVNGEYFISNAKEGCLTKSKDTSFKMTFEPVRYDFLEDCLFIKNTDSINYFHLIDPKIIDSEVIYIKKNKEISSIAINKKEVNLIYAFKADNLISIYSCYNTLENSFILHLHYDFVNLNSKKDMVVEYLTNINKKSSIKYVEFDKEYIRSLRILNIRILSIRTKFMKNKIMDEWVNKTFSSSLKNLSENFKNIRVQFTDFIFSDLDKLQIWSELSNIDAKILIQEE